jgi:hypothetical protein
MAINYDELTREEEIAEVMRTTSLDRGYAEQQVALRRGEPAYGVETLHPLTPAERRAIGLDQTLEEVMAALGEVVPDDDLDDDELLAELGVIDTAQTGMTTRG